MTPSALSHSCFNIRSIGSLWSSEERLRQGDRSWLFQYPLYRITLVVVKACAGWWCWLMFQYPLYRITLVVPAPRVTRPSDSVSISALSDHFGRRHTRTSATAANVVSISALSDHFGRRPARLAARPGRQSFNIRSIGSLWSSAGRLAQSSKTHAFQYPLYRITLVVNFEGGWTWVGEEVSISALSDHFGRLPPLVRRCIAALVSISALSDHFGRPPTAA